MSLRQRHLERPDAVLRDPRSLGLREGLRICISNQFPGDADAAGPGTTLGEPLGWGSHLKMKWGWSTYCKVIIFISSQHIVIYKTVLKWLWRHICRRVWKIHEPMKMSIFFRERLKCTTPPPPFFFKTIFSRVQQQGALLWYSQNIKCILKLN